MKLSLIRFNHRQDFGDDFYIQILNFDKHWPYLFKRRSLLQLSISWNEIPSFPYFQLNMGSNGLLGIVFWVYKFGFDADLFSRTWKFEHLDSLKKCEE